MGLNLKVIPLAKATLLEPTLKAGGAFTTLEGVVLEVGVETEISAHNAMLYMDSHNIEVKFEDSDFAYISEGILENIANKLGVETAEVKDTVLPKKTLAKKATEAVKGTLKGGKAKAEPKEKPVEEEESEEETPSDE